MSKKTFIIIPTYNEAKNISYLIECILGLGLNLHILVVDDNSPDGTAELVKKSKKQFSNLHLLVRTKNKGRGSAGIDGYKYALKNKADYIMEMDADFSHKPKYIPFLLKNINQFDIVIGSRFIKGGKDINRSVLRKTISKLAKCYLRVILKLNIKDPTSGFRVFKKEVLESILPILKSKGPFIITEVLYYSVQKKYKIKEVPISFVNRINGKSKLKASMLFSYFFEVIKLRFKNVKL